MDNTQNIKMRLDKVLSHIGIGSRKDIKKLVKSKKVSVNGEYVSDYGMLISPYTDRVLVAGKEIKYKEFIYLMMNKPPGVLSATVDKYDDVVIDLLEEDDVAFNPFPVGRLDKDTEGLLILTNDGKLSHLLTSPKKHIPKTYYARIEGVVTEEDILAFSKGVTLDDGYETMPGELKILKSEDDSEIELTIYEGKFHQVKRMFESVGKKVTYLKRISMGPIPLDPDLDLGEYRDLTEEEVDLLKSSKEE